MSEKKNTQINNLDDLINLDFGYECTLALPDPELVQYYKDNNERILYIYKDIDEDLLKTEKSIITWNREDEKNKIPVDKRKPITIYLYSYGGDGNTCYSFIDVMKASKTPIKMVCMGIAMSAAAIIFLAAPKGNRYISKHGTILLHLGASTTGGTAQQVLDQADDYKHFLENMKDIVISNTNITKQLYTKKSKKEWYIYAEEAVSLGIADHIYESIEEII